jgi:epoxide hydrolase-like predicted phosphatase
MMLKAVIFDLGGVLLRTENKEPRAELAAEYGMSYQEMSDYVYRQESARRATVGEISAEEHWEEVRKALDLSTEELHAFQKAFWGGDIMDEQLIGFIRALSPAYTTALLSNAWDDLREAMTRDWEIIDAFDHVFISAELGIAKPDPEIYRHVLDALDCEPHEAVFLDDFVENVTGAREVGLHAIHFRSREQALGELRELLDNELI